LEHDPPALLPTGDLILGRALARAWLHRGVHTSVRAQHAGCKWAGAVRLLPSLPARWVPRQRAPATPPHLQARLQDDLCAVLGVQPAVAVKVHRLQGGGRL